MTSTVRTKMEKFWLKNYPPGVPPTIDTNQYQSLVDMMENNFQRYATNIAFSNFGTSITYKELDEQSKQFAAFLQKDLNLTKGERVALMLPNILQYPIAMYGTLRAGLVVVNTNPLYTPPELIQQLNDSGASTIVVVANYAHVLEEALPHTQIKHVIVTQIGDRHSFWKQIIINSVVKYVKKLVPRWKISAAIRFNDALQRGKKYKFEKAKVAGEETAFLQYTGGTTGVPKGAVLTHSNMVANILQCIAWVWEKVKTNQEIVIIALPMYHIFSLTVCCLTFQEIGGQGVLITDPRDLNGFINELKKINFTVFVGVNTLFNGLLRRTEFAKLNFKNLRLSVAGGMAMQRMVAEHWLKVTGNYILEGYGLTEASPVVSINPTNIDFFTGSIGMPVPSTDVKVCDEKGKEVPIGEEGELYVKGPQVMKGYWHKEAETKLVLTEDGWLRTGDIVYFDENGLLYLVDRKKDMIIVSGFNVYPNEVEEVIAAHPGVLEVGVIGVPSEHSGELVKAFIVKKDPNLTKQSIMQFCHDKLTRYKIPKIIEFRESLPKSNIGKILRRKLKEL